MNKLFIVFLAICLVSVHAFVKRDAPAPANALQIQDQIQKGLHDASEFFKNNFNAEAFQSSFGQLTNELNKAFESINKKSDAPK